VQKQKYVYVYIYAITRFVTMWSGAWMVKDLWYGHGGDGSNPIIDILWTWLKLVML